MSIAHYKTEGKKMTEIKETYYAGSDPFEVGFKMKKYMILTADSAGRQNAEFTDDANDVAYIGLGDYDNIVRIELYVLDENGQYVPEKAALARE